MAPLRFGNGIERMMVLLEQGLETGFLNNIFGIYQKIAQETRFLSL